MSTNPEQEQPTVEEPSTEPENVQPTTTEDVQAPPVVEEQKPAASSWFNNFTIPPNLTNQLTNLSSSLMQVTSKVSAAANTLVQKNITSTSSNTN